MASTPIKQQAQEYAVNLLHSRYYIEDNDQYAEGAYLFDTHDIAKAYSDGYTDCKKSMWRNAEDELPEAGTMCLVFGYQDFNDGRLTRYTMMAYYDGEDFTDAYDDRKYRPEKWMEIPLVATNPIQNSKE